MAPPSPPPPPSGPPPPPTPSGTPSPGQPVCPRCGTPPGGGAFCETCGLNLTATPSLPSRAQWEERQRQEEVRKAQIDAYQKRRVESRERWLQRIRSPLGIAVLSSAAVLVVAAIVIGTIVSNDGTEQ